MIDGKQKALALAAHISYLFFGVGYVLVPLALYLFYDKQDDFIAGHASGFARKKGRRARPAARARMSARRAAVGCAAYG